MGAGVASSPFDDGLPWKIDRSAPASCIFRGLLSVHSRFGLHARWITRSDPLHQRLRRICYLLRRSDCFRLERPVAGWDLHPLEIDAFARRTIFGHCEVDAAYDDKLAGKITDEYWLQRSNQWQLDLATANAAIRELENATFDSFATGRTILELSQRAADLYVKQTWTEQARLIGLTHTNSRWDGATLTPAYRKPFDLLAEGLQGVTGGPDGVFTQTFALWIQQPYAVNRRISISAPLVTACSARTSTCSLMI